LLSKLADYFGKQAIANLACLRKDVLHVVDPHELCEDHVVVVDLPIGPQLQLKTH